ncbi:DDHD-domain-containing protein [Hesseltinella vesiculosa]|uniref:DDHD-domain-containing protein n=1 Tax=Hesseltinella vesiculosa TaxID=101127 RepID=A0A1X2GK47_9FUNG|nr:DDHD-domain-containing protein [Hesseltinella vesiculosa]
MKACHEAVTDDDNGIQVLPILWRKSIAFGMASDQAETDMGTHDGLEDGCPTLEEITLDGAPMYRTIVSDVFLDIPLYMTQKYRDQMAGIITKEINRVYQLFLDRHPDFLNNSGKVSILGHSLGSLLAFDILSTQPFTDQEAATLKETQQAAMAAQSADHKHAPALQFPVDNFFAVGSPLGVLLLLRGFKIMSRQVLAKDAKMHWDKSSASLLDQQHVSYYYPAVNNLYNIFHRSDPVAYRLEPLISRHYGAKEKPVPIPYIKGGLKGVLDASFNVGSGLAKTAGAMFDNFKLSWTNNFMRAFATKAEANEQERAVAPVELRSISAESKDYGESKLAMLNARQGRVDYCLQEGILENAYFSALSVHMNYWTDLDVAAMLIREICPSHKPQ